MSREANVVAHYLLCNKLKDIIRTGWLLWNVKRKRVESIAEHVYGVQQLALLMYCEFEYDIDIKKVIFMLAIHELGEAVIGDITTFDMPRKEKERMEHEAVHNILKDLKSSEEIEKLFEEFDEGKTKEAIFAFQCDKLEADLQCKIYDEEKCVDMNEQKHSGILNDDVVKKYMSSDDSWSSMWLKYGQTKYPYDENFRKVSNYLLSNKIIK